jgi:cation diffusion facilitator CzcD-associated flavoprotein CzcO
VSGAALTATDETSSTNSTITPPSVCDQERQADGHHQRPPVRRHFGATVCGSIGTKRICVDTDYYATYSRDNVTLVSVRDHPIERITPAGSRVGSVDHEVDVIVFAIGHDAMRVR